MADPRADLVPEVEVRVTGGPAGSHLPIRPVPLANLTRELTSARNSTGSSSTSSFPSPTTLGPSTTLLPPTSIFRPIPNLGLSPPITSQVKLGSELDLSTGNSKKTRHPTDETNDSAFEDDSNCSRTTPVNHVSIRKWRQRSLPNGGGGHHKVKRESKIEPISILTSTPQQTSDFTAYPGPLSAPSTFYPNGRSSVNSNLTMSPSPNLISPSMGLAAVSSAASTPMISPAASITALAASSPKPPSITIPSTSASTPTHPALLPPPFAATPPSPVISPEPSAAVAAAAAAAYLHNPLLNPAAALYSPTLAAHAHAQAAQAQAQAYGYRGWPGAGDPLASHFLFCPGVPYPPSYLWNHAALYGRLFQPTHPMQYDSGLSSANGSPSSASSASASTLTSNSLESSSNKSAYSPKDPFRTPIKPEQSLLMKQPKRERETSSSAPTTALNLKVEPKVVNEIRAVPPTLDNPEPSPLSAIERNCDIARNGSLSGKTGELKVEVLEDVGASNRLKEETDLNVSVGEEEEAQIEPPSDLVVAVAPPVISIEDKAENAEVISGLELLTQGIELSERRSRSNSILDPSTTLLTVPKPQAIAERRISPSLDVLCDAAKRLEDQVGKTQEVEFVSSAPSSPMVAKTTSIARPRSSSDGTDRCQISKSTPNLVTGYSSPKAERNVRAFLARKSRSSSSIEEKLSPYGKWEKEMEDREMVKRRDMADIQRKYKEKYRELYKWEHSPKKKSGKSPEKREAEKIVAKKAIKIEPCSALPSQLIEAEEEVQSKKKMIPTLKEKLKTWSQVNFLGKKEDSKGQPNVLSLKIKALSAGQNHKKANSEGRWELNSDSKKQLLKFKAKKPNPFENLLRLTSRDGSSSGNEPEKREEASKSDQKFDQPCESQQKSKKSTNVPDTSNGASGSQLADEPLHAPKNGIESEKDTLSKAENPSEGGSQTEVEVEKDKPVFKRSNSIQLKSDQPPEDGDEIQDLHAMKEKKKKAKKAKKLKRERPDSNEGHSHHHHHHKSKKAKKAEKSKSKEKTKEGGEERASSNHHKSSALTEADLVAEQRILTRIDGYFHPGKVLEISPPDVYGIVVDRERGGKPHIYSREEILQEAILDIVPASVRSIPPGTRVCAFWSKKYHHLFPGTVGDPDLIDDKLRDSGYIHVELDDGDSRDIKLDDVRLLPAGYPIVEYGDANPVMTTGKRHAAPGSKRKASSDADFASPESSPQKKVAAALPRESFKVRLNVKAVVKKEPVEAPKPAPSSRDKKPSGIAAFLPKHQLWEWKRKTPEAKTGQVGDSKKRKKTVHHAITRKKEELVTGDCAVFLSTGRPDRPYVGRLDSMWEAANGMKKVRVKWFYHAVETVGVAERGRRVQDIRTPGALFESSHYDENDLQTISHKCEVVPFSEFKARLAADPAKADKIYENNDLYYLAGFHDPVEGTIKFEPDVFSSVDE